MTTYIYNRRGWPDFSWDAESLVATLGEVRLRQGLLAGRMQGLGFNLRAEAILETLTLDVVKSSEIEGEALDRSDVRSSIARRLGLEAGGLAPADRRVEGVVEMVLDATQRHDEPLTRERLFGWHSALFPTGRSGMRRIAVGAWRDDHTGPMQVVSGAPGRERVHFEAPPASRIEDEVTAFLDWFNGAPKQCSVLRAAIAHLWFVTIHPFEDGNGRIARAISDMALAQSERSPQRFYSMSSQIRLERNAYYAILGSTQAGDLDITPWLRWFQSCLGRALDGAEIALAAVFRKARFWETHADKSISERQRLVLNRLLDGFEGKLTSSKWAKLVKCSQDTALRDIDALVRLGVLVKDPAGGRSTSYSLTVRDV
jgi:Fic family protein